MHALTFHIFSQLYIIQNSGKYLEDMGLAINIAQPMNANIGQHPSRSDSSTVNSYLYVGLYISSVERRGLHRSREAGAHACNPMTLTYPHPHPKRKIIAILFSEIANNCTYICGTSKFITNFENKISGDLYT